MSNLTPADMNDVMIDLELACLYRLKIVAADLDAVADTLASEGHERREGESLIAAFEMAVNRRRRLMAAMTALYNRINGGAK